MPDDKPVRRPLVLSLAAALLATWALPAAAADTPDLGALATRTAEALAAAKKKSVAVVDFTDLAGDVTEVGRFVAEQLSVALTRDASGLEVADRVRVRAALRPGGSADPMHRDAARQIGDATGVEALASGTVTPFVDGLSVTVKVLDATTARVLSAFTLEMPRGGRLDELIARGRGEAAAAHQLQAAAGAGPALDEDAAAPASLGPNAVSVAAFAVAIRECRASADGVTCVGTVANLAGTRRTLEFSVSDVYVVDEMGNQSASNRFTFGAVGRAQELEPGLPIKFVMSGKGISPQATVVTAILRFSVRDTFQARGPWQTAVIRNLPLRRD